MKIIENKNHKADVFLKAWMNVRGKKTSHYITHEKPVWQAPEVPRDLPN